MASYSKAEQRLCVLLKRLRVQRHLTQKELAKRVGFPQHVISKIEHGHRRLYATQLFAYVKDGYDLEMIEFVRIYGRIYEESE